MLEPAPKANTSFLTGITVMRAGPEPVLCPFFGKCDGLLVIDGKDGPHVFLPNEARTSESLCDIILEVKPRRLICGFIGETDARALRAAGIDVRLALFRYSLDELVACFQSLPKA